MSGIITTRALAATDYDDLISLYRELMGKLPVLAGTQGYRRFEEILTHPGTHIIGAVATGRNDGGQSAGRVVSVATLHVLANLTHEGRPYALIENVVTLQSWRGQGLARQVMLHAQDLAWQRDAYKIMLLTGKAAGARAFYQKLGYRSDEKHAMTLRRAPLRITE